MSEERHDTTQQAAALLVGRLLLAAIFLHDGAFKITTYAPSVAYARAFGVPDQLLPLAIVVELGCGVLVAVGLYARTSAVLLAGFCLFTAAVFHANFADRNQLIHFEKNLAMAGGFLTLWVAGPGRLSLACWLVRK